MLQGLEEDGEILYLRFIDKTETRASKVQGSG